MVEPSVLQKYSLFGGLLEDQIKKILPLMEQEHYKPGEEIIVEGTPNDKIRFILDGCATVEKNGVHLTAFTKGDAFGEMEVLDVMPSAATIKAESEISALSISNRGLHEIYKIDVNSFSLIIMNLARDLSRRLRKMDDKVVEGAEEK